MTRATDLRVLEHMPAWLEQRHHTLNEAARSCYGLRNAAEHYQDHERAGDYHALGDDYFARALAIGAEWES